MISICGLMIPTKVAMRGMWYEYQPHTWNSESQKPERYILGYSFQVVALVEINYHMIRKQFGKITKVAGMVGDNAQTQNGHKSGLVK